MNLSLRKASVAQNALNQQLQSLDLSGEIFISQFQNPEFEINNALAKFQENSKLRSEILDAIFDIRVKIGTQNQKSGINAILAESASIDKDIIFYENVSKYKNTQSFDVIQSRLNKIKNSTSDYYDRNDNDGIKVSIFSETDISTFVENTNLLRKRKNQLKDKLLTLNMTTEIEVKESTYQLLEKLNII